MRKGTARVIHALRFPGVFILSLWTIHTLIVVSGMKVSYLGVFPRKLYGLPGIVMAPLLHGDWQHLISNTVPLAALTIIIFLFFRRVAVKSFLLIYILTGLAVWLFARPVFHIGASGVVYGLVAFVFWSGIFRRSLQSIVLSLIILIMYSGYFLGVVPGEQGISWESHLYGAMSGILVSWLYRGKVEADEVPPPPPRDDTEPSEYFLPRDVFDKTIAERMREQHWH